MTLEEARKIVFEAKPAFAELYFKYKDKSWSQYAVENYPTHFKAPENFGELHDTLQDIFLPLLGKERTRAALDTLKNTGFVSTADHSGVLCHPFFTNSNLLRNALARNGSAIISFTCGGVSLTNSSYPRGILFHDRNLKEIRIPLVSLKGRRRSVYGLPAFTKKHIEQIMDSIPHLDLIEKAKVALDSLFKAILKADKIFQCERYSDQLIILNEFLWYLIFGYDHGMLIYIEAERTVRDLLLRVHLSQDTLIHRVLFDATTRQAYIENFENVAGAHNTLKHRGSHIFWYIDEKTQTRVQLFLSNQRLESLDQKFSIELKPEILRHHLENYTLLPSMAFCYSTLAFYYGLTLGGGFSQIKYLGDIKTAWEKTAALSDSQIKHPRTDVFTGEFVLPGVSSGSVALPASLIDIFLYNEGDKTLNHIENMVKEMPIGDTIDAMMGEFVEIITGEKPVIEDVRIHKTLHV